MSSQDELATLLVKHTQALDRVIGRITQRQKLIPGYHKRMEDGEYHRIMRLADVRAGNLLRVKKRASLSHRNGFAGE